MSYKIIRNKKLPKSLSITFKSYEAARSAVRKWLRKYTEVKTFDHARVWYANPSITDYGFSIKKVC